MDGNNREFLKRLLETFRVEAEEHIRAISAGLMDLEKNPGEDEFTVLIETIFREAHSLKGAARSVDLKEIEAVCQPLEGAFSALKRGEITLSPALFDLFHRAINVITQLISSPREKRTTGEKSKTRELISRLAELSRGAETKITSEEPPRVIEPPAPEPVMEAYSAGESSDGTAPQAADERITMETVRIPTARLDPILLQAEEMILIKMAAGQRVIELKEIDHALASLKDSSEKWKEQGPGVMGRGVDTVWKEISLSTLQDKLTAVTRVAEQDFRTISRMVEEHLESMKQLLMLPASALTEVFPKMVRDLARDQGKEAELVIIGAEIEIDKRILEELKDPLIHLLRNCIDHGIKKPEERILLNKKAKGTISIDFRIKDGRQLEILVSDDGEGIDEKKVHDVAIKSGYLSRETSGSLEQRKIIPLIFASGITTSPMITDISGRGLGLAIVREKAEKLGGTVSVETHSGRGTAFRLAMPLTLATFSGVLVRTDEYVFVLPTLNVERAVIINREEIGTVENRETINLDGHIISLVRLCDVLELPAVKSKTTESISAVVIKYGDSSIAFQVDEVLEEHQVLVKGLGRQLVRVRNIAGATVLGTGRVVPVLNVPDLLKSALKTSAPARIEETGQLKTVKPINILVAEDSITARTLIKNILETAGYRITTAVDGMDAFIRARSGEFDLVVSDVDMPRMNGFELAAKIRNDKKLADLPVVLVTALESREDREHGIEAGANAYIVKSSFDQSNLLEVVKRLL